MNNNDVLRAIPGRASIIFCNYFKLGHIYGRRIALPPATGISTGNTVVVNASTAATAVLLLLLLVLVLVVLVIPGMYYCTCR